MERYNISKTSRFLNISNELLRHYERLGLIEPERGENGYRFFNYRDMDKLQGIRRYRNMNFSLEDMDKLIYTAGYDEVSSLYATSLEETKQKIIWYEELKKATEQIVHDWKQVEGEVGKCRISISKDILRVHLRRNDVLDETVVTEELAEWIEKMPVVFISPYFCRDAILEGREEISFGYGVEESFERLEMNHIPSEEYIHSCKCVTTIIYSHGEGAISCTDLQPVVEYCRQNHLTICGDAWGITIGNCNRDGEPYRYHRVYVPVE